jgi:hypothetical protein
MVRCVRIDADQVSEFRIVEVADELIPAVQPSNFLNCDGVWIKRFPVGTPLLDRAWANFEWLIVPWPRQWWGWTRCPGERLSSCCASG